MSEEPAFTQSSGNVFADLGLPDADDLLIKADLVGQIAAVIKRRKLTQAQAAGILGVDQPKVSALLRGQLGGFSLDRIIRFLARLGATIEIHVAFGQDAQAMGSVTVAVSEPRVLPAPSEAAGSECMRQYNKLELSTTPWDTASLEYVDRSETGPVSDTSPLAA